MTMTGTKDVSITYPEFYHLPEGDTEGIEEVEPQDIGVLEVEGF
jgi:hypothetical protein